MDQKHGLATGNLTGNNGWDQGIPKRIQDGILFMMGKILSVISDGSGISSGGCRIHVDRALSSHRVILKKIRRFFSNGVTEDPRHLELGGTRVTIEVHSGPWDPRKPE